ncbi:MULTISPECIES: DUF3331 domain-containing protein [unclassified Paraburkholderia]|uniref:DUF3331 domain-containing protein n=1 Tax=unclassified Paraburkholderia TaxID=2615204 RepID=UPI002AB7F2B6|nr:MULTISPECIES: DUF3331 domain-containing protein [unclassified Paraburkholderia]
MDDANDETHAPRDCVDAATPDCPHNPWAHVVSGLLASPASRTSVSRRASATRTRNDLRPADDNTYASCTVTIEERLANSSFTLSWSDPTRCSYREQVWKRAIARKSGVCVLSGERIKRGDAVFRPLARRYMVPLNSGAMILAVSLEALGARLADPE